MKVFACLGTSSNDIELLVAWAPNLEGSRETCARLGRDIRVRDEGNGPSAGEL